MEKIIKWFCGNHVAANFLMLVVVLAGFTTWFKLKKEIFPSTAFDAVAIQVPYPNATPDEVASGVIIPIEEAIADIEGIKRVTSTATRNIGAVTVEVDTGYETRNIMDDVKTQVDAIDNFAENAERPLLEELVVNTQVMSIAISADTDEKTLRILGEKVRDGLLSHEHEALPPMKELMPMIFKGERPWADFKRAFTEGIRGTPTITKVELAAVRPYELSIEVSEDKLREQKLTLAQVANAVRRASLDLPSGSVKTGAGEILVRAVGKRYTAEEFRSIVIRKSPDGSELILDEIAEVIDGFEEIDLSAKFNGQRAVVLHIFRVGEQDTLAVADLAKNYLEKARMELPEGVELKVWNDGSEMLQGRLDLLMRNIGTGLLLVLLVLTLFLRPSLAFLVALGIPVSFAGGIWLMLYVGISINMISAFAFILVLGIVVDDAIVVGENVYTRIQGGEHPKQASWKGTHEVGVVVIFGVLTTMAAFTPMLGLSGVSGKIWPNIPLIVIPTLMFSLLQSKFVLPAHLAFLRPSGKVSRNPLLKLQHWIAGGLEKFIHSIYRPFLVHVLKLRWVVLCCFLALIMATAGFVKGGWVPFEFFPKVEGEILSAKLEMPHGVPFEKTREVVDRLEAAARELGVEMEDRDGNSVLINMMATSGMQPFIAGGFNPAGPPTGTHLGEVTLELSPAANRDVSADELKVRWQEILGDVDGVVELSFKAETAAGGNAIDVNLTGPDRDQLEIATAWAKEKLADYAGVIEISDTNRKGREELRVYELSERGRALGFDLVSVMGQVRDAFYGNEVQRLQRGRDELKVMVRFPREERESVHSLEQMKLRSPSGAEVPLLEVIQPESGRGPATIRRVDRFETIGLKADVDRAGGYNSDQIVERYTTEVLDLIEEKFPGVRYTYEGEQKDQRESMRELMIGFAGALLLMYVLMAIPLKSYYQPLIVMCVIPFGMIGAVAGHVFMDLNLSIMSMCGVVALAGVLVNDSLVLVDYVNRHRKESPTIMEAVQKAGARRFRPILLTSLTTFAGLFPMLRETDMQARFLIPMAVSLGFGILFATAITLILVPVVYLIMEDLSRFFHLIKRGWKWVFSSGDGEAT